MTAEPRYREDEVREIFERAATAAEGRALTTTRDGFTLAELQAIGRDVGIDPGRIADAAAALEVRRGALPRQTLLGMPVSVGRTVSLSRAPTDHEWEQLVAVLRETFHAAGKVRVEGGLRQWTNGNLGAFVEREDDGWRLRLRTRREDAAPYMNVGIAGVAVGIAIALFMVLTGTVTDDILGALILFMGGLGFLGYNAIRLPAWAAERERQMEHVAERMRALLDTPEPGAPPTSRKTEL